MRYIKDRGWLTSIEKEEIQQKIDREDNSGNREMHEEVVGHNDNDEQFVDNEEIGEESTAIT